MTADVVPEQGWVDSAVAGEFPDLRLISVELEARPGRSPEGVKERLRDLSDGFRGATAVMMRQQPIPWAHRVFFRHIGLDPDVDRTPVEAMAVERLKRGGFKSRNLLDDAITIATMETGVGVWALDAATISGDLGIRQATEREPLGRRATSEYGPPPLPAGRLVVADDAGAVAILFGDIAPGHGVTPQTSRMRLFSVQVAGVPAIHVEEALWLVTEMLLEGPRS